MLTRKQANKIAVEHNSFVKKHEISSFEYTINDIYRQIEAAAKFGRFECKLGGFNIFGNLNKIEKELLKKSFTVIVDDAEPSVTVQWSI